MYTFWSVISKILKKNPNYLEIELKMIVLPDGIHLWSLLVDKPKQHWSGEKMGREKTAGKKCPGKIWSDTAKMVD